MAAALVVVVVEVELLLAVVENGRTGVEGVAGCLLNHGFTLRLLGTVNLFSTSFSMNSRTSVGATSTN